MEDQTTDAAVDADSARDLIINLLRQIGPDTNSKFAALGGAMSKVFSEIEPRRRQALFEAHLSAITDAWPGLMLPRRRFTWARLLTVLFGT
jgi:hypothetical protein